MVLFSIKFPLELLLSFEQFILVFLLAVFVLHHVCVFAWLCEERQTVHYVPL